MSNRTSESVRRAVFSRAFGRCEYGQCSQIAARCDEGGNISGPGEFAHILPLGNEGRRAEFKDKFPDVDLDSPKNVILLCREHHRAVDVEQEAQHPPQFLFAMVARKSAHMSDALAEVYISHPYRFDHAEVLQDTRIGRIFDLLTEANNSGPRGNKKLIARAANLLREIEVNPFVPTSAETVELIRLEITIKGVANSYSSSAWGSALAAAERSLRKLRDQNMVAGAIMLIMEFVRDPYSVFSHRERLRLIKSLLDRLDPIILATADDGFISFLLGIKAGLLRWQGRLQQSTIQQSTYGEAERCAERGLAAANSCAGLLQLALVKFAKSRSLPLSRLQQHDKLVAEASATLTSSDLDEFSAAIKYRPRYFRDIYELPKRIDFFWRAVDFGYAPEMSRDAFVIGESSVAAYSASLASAIDLERATEFLHCSIESGYDHGRNFMAWISCRARLDPDWFESKVLRKFDADGKPINPIAILRDDLSRNFGDESFNHDALFGVDEIEFWNLLGRLCRTALSSPEKSLAYYDVAARYGGGGGNYTTKVGRFRALVQKRDIAGAKKLLASVRSSTRAYQAQILHHLESELRNAESAASAE